MVGRGGRIDRRRSVLSENIAASVQTTRFTVADGFRGGDQSRSSESRSDEVHSLIFDSLDEDGALEIVSIDLAGKSSEADVMVVASGRSTRHVSSIADKLVERLKEAGYPSRSEGREAADWVLIDVGDVIVHIFRPEVREFYQLEKMWQMMPDAAAQPVAVR